MSGGAGKRRGQRGGTCTASAAMGWGHSNGSGTARHAAALTPTRDVSKHDGPSGRVGSASPRLERPRYLRRAPHDRRTSRGYEARLHECCVARMVRLDHFTDLRLNPLSPAASRQRATTFDELVELRCDFQEI